MTLSLDYGINYLLDCCDRFRLRLGRSLFLSLGFGAALDFECCGCGDFHFGAPPCFPLLTIPIIKHLLYFVKRKVNYFLDFLKFSLDKRNPLRYPLLWGDYMDIARRIKTAAAFAGKTEADLARVIGTTPQNFSQRQRVGKWTEEEREQIAAALGAKYVCYFEFPSGEKI